MTLTSQVFALAILALAALPLPPASAGEAPVAALMDESVPKVARQACLKKVRAVTKAKRLVILEMVYSEANSQMKIGVGPDKAPWKCLVSRRGIVAEVMSLVDEGKL